MALILASSSRYRRAQLERMQLEFRWVAPDLDESALPGENGLELALRLAQAKAQAVSKLNPLDVVIGCDQTMVLGAEIHGKPNNSERAFEMLRCFSGKRATFHSALALVHAGELLGSTSVPTHVQFRELSESTIGHYLAREPALDCAGGFKSEALGLALVQSIESTDPSALIGLPLIALLDLLRANGIDPLG